MSRAFAIGDGPGGVWGYSGASSHARRTGLCDHEPIASVAPASSHDGAGAPPRRGPANLGLFRSSDNRVFAGVAGGLGERLGVDPALVRAALVVLALAGGTGVVVYLVAYALAAEPPSPGTASASRHLRREPTSTSTKAFGLIVFGALLILRDLGLWFGDPLVWPIALAAVGWAVIWGRGDEAGRARWGRLAGWLPGNPVQSIFAPGRVSLLRLLSGGFLVAVGMTLLLAAFQAVQLGGVIPAVLITLTGAALVLGPWISRLGREVSEERRERIRSEERAEMAAHLHDSVLQTLALIQRSTDARETAALARAQERELRAWLYGRGVGHEENLLSSAVESLAGRVEQLHHVKVEVVVVGDGPVDARARAVVRAVGEAVHNAAKHSGAEVVSVYVESAADGLHAYVTDEGKGFDPAHVPGDRRGIADSIIGRIQRHGGSAAISSEIGEGTEVHVFVPRNSNGMGTS